MKRFLCLLLSLVLVFPCAAFAAAQTEELYYLRGDVNNDGMIATGDARTVLRFVIGLETEETLAEKCNDAQNYDYYKAADADGDGYCYVGDARLTLRAAVNLERLPAMNQDLNVNIGAHPDWLDPAFAVADNELTLVQNLFAGLTKYETDVTGNTRVVADCATNLPVGVELQDGRMSYEFILRNDLRWSDGTPLTAEDFVYAWNRAADPDNEAPCAYLFYDIDGYAQMQEDPAAKLNVRANGNKLTVVTAYPCTYLFDLLTNSIFMPVKKSVVEKNENWANSASSFVGNGAFAMSQWDDSQIVLTRNEFYHVKESRKRAETITFLLTTDENTVRENYAAGNLHFTNNGMVAAEYGFSGRDFCNIDVMGTYYYVFNVNKSLLPPSSDLTGAEKEKAEAQIRKALSLLINRQAILEEIEMPTDNAASTLVAKAVSDVVYTKKFYENAGSSTAYHGYFDTKPAAYEQNCKDAVAILRQYYKYDTATGRFTDFPGVEILHNGEGHDIIAQCIQDDLAAYGLQVNINITDWAMLLTARQNGTFEWLRDGWIADYNDPVNFLEMFYSESGNNTARLGMDDHASVGAYSLDLTPLGYDYKVSNATWQETYDVLISLAWFETDLDLRYKLLHMAEDLLMETGAVTPLYYYSSFCLQSEHVKGIFFTPYGIPVFTNAVVC
ncbi:MAG: hypothetical protein IKM24_10895 [Clostridia bacterium]|nr:hypothetical protein [Clostridia bacterium]